MMNIVRYVSVLLAVIITGCAGGKKLADVQKSSITAQVAAGNLDDLAQMEREREIKPEPQVIQIEDIQGNSIVMNAVKDEESGEMVAVEELDEIVVVAKFRHVAERNGSVDLVFELSVPMALQQKRWQVRFTPKYHILEDTLVTDKIFITGRRFRAVQNWEYHMYNNYMRKIIPQTDSLFIRDKQLEYFLSRLKGNRYKGEDNTIMSDKAEQHYRKRILEKINSKMDRAKLRMYNKFVVDPFPDGGVRLDSVVYDKSMNGIRYYYVQNIKTRPGLKKVEMVMEGEVYTNGRKLCRLAGTAPVTFYISSISAFADNTERYLKKIVHRDLHLSTSYNIGFRKGKWDIDPSFSLNGKELLSIRRNIAQILENEEYAMDSILISASGSPDGKLHINEKVSEMRGKSIKKYVSDYVRFFRDSAERSVWDINEDENYKEERRDTNDFKVENIRISAVSEDWDLLYSLVCKDTLMKNRGEMLALYGIADLDAREDALRRTEDFAYVQENLYPRLRRVQFDFKLHRKGMLKDTVHTTELDTVYMKGVDALKERDYKQAVSLLRPYRCYNTAVAYVCMDYNKSALEILQELPRDARRDYILAVVYSRLGDEKKAVQYFVNSVEQDEAMKLRGNLDPEIGELIKRYNIF